MDGLTQSLLLGAVITLAITLSMLMRPQKDLRQRVFILFSGNLALWYLTDFLSRWLGHPAWTRIKLGLALLLPITGIIFFRSFIETRGRRRYALVRLAALIAILLLAVVLSPYYAHPVAQGAVLVHVLGFLLFAVFELHFYSRSVTSRTEAARISYLVWGAFISLLFLFLDRLSVFGVDFPPIGSTLTIVYLYIIMQAIVRRRLFDLYEMIGRLAVLVALAISLALIFTVMVYWAKSAFFLNALLASLVILILFDPLREAVEQRIQDFFLTERRDLERQLVALKRQIARTFDLGALAAETMSGLEGSRRMTQASLYLADAAGRGFVRHGGFGHAYPDRIDGSDLRNLQTAFSNRGTLVKERLEDERERLMLASQRRDAVRLGHVIRTLKDLKADVVVPIEGEVALMGFLQVGDDRRQDSFTSEEISLLEDLASQIAIGIENSELYQKMQERDRLVAMGKMSAGLAHEIRNPLGAIKAAAQLIEEQDAGPAAEGGGDKENLAIIIEEVDRLNRVVSAFLDYARPFSGNPEILDVNEAIRKTLQVLVSEPRLGVRIREAFLEPLPRVRIDPEKLRQALINLILNAIEALPPQGGDVWVKTGVRSSDGKVEVVIQDTGPGIPADVRPQIFTPFYTTKDKGTGLGLAICLRIVRSAGGDIEVESEPGQGTTVSVYLPPAEDKAGGCASEPRP